MVMGLENDKVGIKTADVIDEVEVEAAFWCFFINPIREGRA